MIEISVQRYKRAVASIFFKKSGQVLAAELQRFNASFWISIKSLCYTREVSFVDNATAEGSRPRTCPDSFLVTSCGTCNADSYALDRDWRIVECYHHTPCIEEPAVILLGIEMWTMKVIPINADKGGTVRFISYALMKGVITHEDRWNQSFN